MQANNRKGRGGRPRIPRTPEAEAEKKQNKHTSDHERREKTAVKLEKLKNGTEEFNKEMEWTIDFFKENLITDSQTLEVELRRLQEEDVKNQHKIRELKGEAKAQQEIREEFLQPFIQHQFITRQDLTKHDEKRREIQNLIAHQETETERCQVRAKELLGFFREYTFSHFNPDQKDEVEKHRRNDEESKAKIENLQNMVRRQTEENRRLQELHKKLPEDGNSVDFEDPKLKKLKVEFNRRLPDEILKLESVNDQLKDKIKRLEKLTKLFECFKESQMAYSVFLLQCIMQRLYKNFPGALHNQDCKDKVDRNFQLLLGNLRDVTWSGQAGAEKQLLELSGLVNIVDDTFSLKEAEAFTTTTTSDKMETNVRVWNGNCDGLIDEGMKGTVECIEELLGDSSTKMETTGQKNQEFTRANELVWNNACGRLIDLGMDLPEMKEADDFICDYEGPLSCNVDELLGDSSTDAKARFSEEISNLDCAALIPPGPGTTSHFIALDVLAPGITSSHVTPRNDVVDANAGTNEGYAAVQEKVEEPSVLSLAKQTDAGEGSSHIAPSSRLLTVEKGKSVMLEGGVDSLLSSSYVTLPINAHRGRGRGRSSRGRSSGSRGRGLNRNASLASVDAGKRHIVSEDPNPRPQQRLRPLGVTTPIPSPVVEEMSLWNSVDVTKSRAATLFSESDNAVARTFLNTCTPEDVLQLNCFKLLNVCQVAIQEARSRGAELARARGQAERAFAREKVASSTVEHLKKECSSLELQVRRNRRAYVESWVGSQSFANTLVPLKDYQYAMGFSQCRELIAKEDPDYDISWLRATPTERFKRDGWTLMLEPLMPPPVYFDEDGGVPPHPPQYAPYEDEVPFPSEDGGQAQEE